MASPLRRSLSTNHSEGICINWSRKAITLSVHIFVPYIASLVLLQKLTEGARRFQHQELARMFAPHLVLPGSAPSMGVLWSVTTGKSKPCTSHRSGRSQVVLARAAPNDEKEVVSLSDIIGFESTPRDTSGSAGTANNGGHRREESPDPEELVRRATAALDAARAALEAKRQQSQPQRSGTFSYSSSRRDLRSTDAFRPEDDQDARRADLERLLAADRGSMSWDDEEAEVSGGKSGGAQPSWSEGFLSTSSRDGQSSADEWVPQMARMPVPDSTRAEMELADRPSGMLEFLSQDAQDVTAARTKSLPPLQSVMDLTTAFQPPQRGEAPVSAEAAPSSAGQVMADGKGQLADGTKYLRESGEDYGPNGYWRRWTSLKGVSAAGKVEWEERWWEESDWAGMRELGAEKSGCRADGAAWFETWREAIAFDQTNGEPIVERSAHKWACDGKGEEWEERWGEQYWSLGRANKFADKWGKEGNNVWHERWGEDYDGDGGCVKYTDKWAERLMEGGGNEQWGDKWEERFKHGAGSKQGETWTVSGSGERYQRWWGEDHFGNGWVRKHGNSSTGEHWDVSEQMDTYYNPIPHFTYKMALDHSPTLKNVPTVPRGGDELGSGIDDL